LIILMYYVIGALLLGIPMAIYYEHQALKQISRGKIKATRERRAKIKWTMLITVIAWPWAIITLLLALYKEFFPKDD